MSLTSLHKNCASTFDGLEVLAVELKISIKLIPNCLTVMNAEEKSFYWPRCMHTQNTNGSEQTENQEQSVMVPGQIAFVVE